MLCRQVHVTIRSPLGTAGRPTGRRPRWFPRCAERRPRPWAGAWLPVRRWTDSGSSLGSLADGRLSLQIRPGTGGPAAGSQSSLGSQPRHGGTDGKPKRQSKLQYVLETLSACGLFVMSQQSPGSGTPSLLVLLPPLGEDSLPESAESRAGGRARRQRASRTHIGHFLSCFRSEH